MAFGTKVFEYWALGPSGQLALKEAMDQLSSMSDNVEGAQRAKMQSATSCMCLETEWASLSRPTMAAGDCNTSKSLGS